MTGCDPARISAYYDGDLAAWDRRDVQRHLAVCPDCARTLAEYRTIGAGIRALPDVAPPAVVRMRVFSRHLHTRKDFGQPGSGPLVVAGAVALAAVLVMTLSALFNGVLEQSGPPARAPRTARQVAPTSSPAELAMKAQPTVPPAAGPSDSRQAAPKPALTAPAPAAKPAATQRPASAAPAAATPVPTPTAPKPSPTIAPPPTAVAIAQATVAPTPRSIGLLGIDPPAVLTPTTAITVTGVVSEVVKGQQLTLRADDGNEWRVALTTTETITRTDGGAVSLNDLRPGLRIGVVGRPGNALRSLFARVLTVLAPDSTPR